MFNDMIKKLKGQNKKIVFTEGEDIRVLTAAARLANEGVLVPVVLGRKDVISKLAKENKLNISKLEIIQIDQFEKTEELVERMFELRKGKMTLPEVRQLLTRGNYFGTMLVERGYADGLLGGATYSTADTVRPALQIIKTKPGCNLVSSAFLMRRVKDGVEERYIMADCAINLHPDENQVVEIALASAETAKIFDIDPKVVLLSYSSYGSGKGEDVEKMTNAACRLKEMNLPYPVDGELQFDAAFSMDVAKIKAPTSQVAGRANVFIFPDINAGNIGYKIAQRLGDFEALGPILQGLNAPINDLSRGCNTEEVYKMAIITALQK
ncbi:MAG TPA: phosphate acetyltransferase [Acholeplasmataceae bacterium]|nr:phosphate acetyltransferase [Acholeplasmataceae bacterium]HQC30221.1 phosphate acetyltransferase [Acholeplasmataceae bacterium]